MNKIIGALLFLAGVLGVLSGDGYAAAETPPLYGALQSTLEHAEKGRKAGWNVAIVAVAWDAFEPRKGEIDEVYVGKILDQAKAFRALGYRLQLDLGMQYPPGWIFETPRARYKNQFGVEFDSTEPGKKIPNYVFNGEVRAALASYLEKIFSRLGTDWDWVRLGGGFYGEVNFPQHRFGKHVNCYWGFDDIAQGKTPGLPEGMKVCPVPGWIPGTTSPGQRSARMFLDWYLESLQQYHDWQIATVRKWYAGEICMMYGSWGIRPGWIETALQTHLDGSSAPEKHGEISMSYDWERMIGGIRDPKVMVYCTWIDAPRKDCDDEGTNRERWSPVHWQASLAAGNPLKLKVWGENTGQNDRGAMELTFERVRRFDLRGVMWAFENQLFADPNPQNFATFADFEEMIRKGASDGAHAKGAKGAK